ncbi:response regulator [Ktedonosporobacter rubrisoli]|uniref:Response regulator n=1 Tax=Ktedonosporobacter rubrisoli TaxID=2509675 RepID=A0A4P6K128_KTERU|nr:response regulator [Ktedonosporobacter rubrisoli]QBD81360.1 response regulator [Ktedonosporobacter rubrisoli]
MLDQDNASKLILVVEDDHDVADFIFQALKGETPYEILLVNDGHEALKLIQSKRPQLCLLDYQLPHMNGLELYENMITTDESLKAMHVLFMSASIPKSEMHQRHLLYIEKPFELDLFLNLVDNLLTQQ